MRHIQLEPSEIIVAHAMTLQDLRNCELMVERGLRQFKERDGAIEKQVVEKLSASLKRITKTRIEAEKEAARAHSGNERVVHSEEL